VDAKRTRPSGDDRHLFNQGSPGGNRVAMGVARLLAAGGRSPRMPGSHLLVLCSDWGGSKAVLAPSAIACNGEVSFANSA
jgi:hypothetical protein